MELRQLAYFVAVAEERHFTRAAERVTIAQPAVSQQIRRLEAELGEELFVRDRRAVALTAAGEALLPHARAALAAVAGAREAVGALSGLLTGRLAVGLVQPLPDRQMSRLLGEFRRRHPHVELALIEGEPEALGTSLSAGRLDVAVIALGRYDRPPPDLETRLIATEPVVVALHPEHLLATRAAIALRALRKEPMVTLVRGSRLRNTLEAACRTAGFAARARVRSGRLRPPRRGRDERSRPAGRARRRADRRRDPAGVGARGHGRRRRRAPVAPQARAAHHARLAPGGHAPGGARVPRARRRAGP